MIEDVGEENHVWQVGDEIAAQLALSRESIP